jgi:TatD DNase family protein
MRAICKEIPLEQILVETDAPYMAPEPHRGKRCESAFVVETARCLATLKGLSLEEVAAITTENALRLFSTMR